MEEIKDQKTKVFLNNLAKTLDHVFNPNWPGQRREIGFAVLMFNFDQPHDARMNWISNADRGDMIVALKEMLNQFEGGAHEEPKRTQ